MSCSWRFLYDSELNKPKPGLAYIAAMVDQARDERRKKSRALQDHRLNLYSMHPSGLQKSIPGDMTA